MSSSLAKSESGIRCVSIVKVREQFGKKLLNQLTFGHSTSELGLDKLERHETMTMR